MDPRLDEQEQDIMQRARRAARQHVAPIAGTVDQEAVAPRSALAALAGDGCFEGFDGLGPASRVRLALLAEEIGYESASVAGIVVNHAAALSLLSSIDLGEGDAVVAGVRAGDKIAALAFDAGTTVLDTLEPLSGTAADGGVTIDGRAAGVPGAAIADLLVVPVRLDDGGARVALFASASPGVTVGSERAKLGLNGSGMADIELGGATATADDLAVADDTLLEAVLDFLRIGHAATSVGIARAALEAGRRHVLDAGDSLTRSQSIQWMLADAATETDAARLLTWYAATRPAGDELAEVAPMARLVATDTAVKASRNAVQITGGGADEDAVGRLYRDAKALEIHHGSREAQRRAAARRMMPDLVDAGAAG